ncbi:hypothetical protein COX86_03780 [Candidatus Micrarchaeota archaeon CG_4_10_14_0_2_um_filter_60_11]|nr:MAG: hypothetical protein AUJ16_02325 [Candidatus Micrarchaeota archaeon CG1_02_60_51]PIN96581.1 MAG: hypothetical protein COU39_00560 [Candidatus Micrarchaeota archaeon CG10_big_fil_rev_8_21_14_0_10_60_32]PIO02194.1 MAG: hypothetical protein COT58_01295 [Candidatus Micrarchaeota archaeon CG09_land_8_20_14_0_10_60_16]PIY91599.1 MAG: hypothetical protein COY71_02290 [Candidatus Micrarchaeota archaeon CG_4_10_14_0_8_um_filter_60_7]PIZ90663.1 MAG: hypothetical protein COX86_03780 [Candidatus Mi
MPQTSAMLKPRETAEIARGERALVYRSGNVVRRVYAASQGDPQVDFYLLRIASALFPGKFLEPVRFTLPSGRTFLGSKPNKAAVYTRFADLDKNHRTFVKHATEKNFRFCDCLPCVTHAMRVRVSKRVKAAARKFRQAGLAVNVDPHNAAFAGRKPLFLSIETVDYPALEQHISKTCRGEKRERLLSLLQKANTLEGVFAATAGNNKPKAAFTAKSGARFAFRARRSMFRS